MERGAAVLVVEIDSDSGLQQRLDGVLVVSHDEEVQHGIVVAVGLIEVGSLGREVRDGLNRVLGLLADLKNDTYVRLLLVGERRLLCRGRPQKPAFSRHANLLSTSG